VVVIISYDGLHFHFATPILPAGLLVLTIRLLSFFLRVRSYSLLLLLEAFPHCISLPCPSFTLCPLPDPPMGNFTPTVRICEFDFSSLILLSIAFL